MTEIIHVPHTLLLHRTDSLELLAQHVTPGLTASGVMPVISTDGGGLWQRSVGDVVLSTKAQRKAWRAIAAKCDGGANPLVVPFVDNEHQPWAVVGGSELMSYDSIAHSDGTYFSDGSGYYNPAISAYSVGSASLGATTITIHFVQGGPLTGGEHFSIDHTTESHHTYRVVSVELDGSGDSVCTIRPRLREAVASLTTLEFDKPLCLMRPHPPQSLHLVTDMIGMARPNPVFLEHFL